MGSNHECSADMDGKRAAVDLAMATRPDDFSHKCWSIDQTLNNNNPEYARSFVNAMNTELQNRNLLPKIELNMVAAGDTPAMLALQNNKHVDTQDLLQSEDQLHAEGRNTEAMLTRRLASAAPEIHDTHAERNFWGKNHGGIDMDRLNRWADHNRADMRGAFEDTLDSRVKPITSLDKKDCPPDAAANDAGKNNSKEHNEYAKKDGHLGKDGHIAKDDPRATDYDKEQDANIRDLNKKVEHDEKARGDIEKANQLKAKVEAGVIKDAHHTVQHGETLYDMARLALHKAGRDHQTPAAIKFEEEKIRALNGLGPHQALHSGQPLMLRTKQEVEHETERRIKLNHTETSPVPRPEWHAPAPGFINQRKANLYAVNESSDEANQYVLDDTRGY